MSADTTAERITTAALSLFLARGVRKTDLTEVAYQAGVARVTVYRYCGDKRGLLRSVCMRIAAIFQKAAKDDAAEDPTLEAEDRTAEDRALDGRGAEDHGAEDRTVDSSQDFDLRLNRLGQELSNLPKGNLLACLEETRRLYPEVYEEFRAVRQAAVDQIFQQALDMATREQMLREGINLEVLKAIFWAAVVGLLENPTLISSNVSLAEIFATVTEVFRHGILIPTPSGTSQKAAVPAAS